MNKKKSLLISIRDLKKTLIEYVSDFSEDEINELHEINSEISAEVNKIEILEEEKNNTVCELDKNISLLKIEVETEKNKLKNFNTDYEMVELWISLLEFKNEGSIKQFIISKIIPVFNNIINEIVQIIFNNTLTIIFDNFLDEVIYYNDRPFKYQELSTGEKTKLNLCINLAIFDLTRLNLIGSSILFLDEVFSFVDSNSIQLFINLIKNRYAKQSAVYFISHIHNVESILAPESIIHIKKENEESTIHLL